MDRIGRHRADPTGRSADANDASVWGDAAAWSELIDNASVRLLDPTRAEWIDGNLARLAKTQGDGAGVFDNADRGAAAAAPRRRRLFEIGRAPAIL